MSDLLNKINSLSIFKGVRSREPLLSLCKFLKVSDTPGTTQDELIEAYSEFVYSLYEDCPDGDISRALWDSVIADENPYLKHTINQITGSRNSNKEISRLMHISVEKELDILNELGNLSFIDVERMIYYDGYVPQFKSTGIDIKSKYMNVIENLGKKGYGVYAKYLMFKIKNGKLVPVKNPDKIEEKDLVNYERQRGLIVDNTRAFIEGKPAQDALLYGDAGTGKSSTVKAVAKKFAPEGVRLVELPKSEIDNLADVIDMLSLIPMKFIVFIDDVSFDADDERIGSLKSVLEGAAGGSRTNIIIYATSNRRHMVKETFSDRSNEIHSSDTIAEQLSLSERFGLRVLFETPNKFVYLDIIRGIMQARKLEIPEDLDSRAEAYALRKGGRSARVARQFVDSLEI